MKILVLIFCLCSSAGAAARAENSVWADAFPDPSGTENAQLTQKLNVASEELGAAVVHRMLSLEEAEFEVSYNLDGLSRALDAKIKQQLMDEDPFIAAYFRDTQFLRQDRLEAERALARGTADSLPGSSLDSLRANLAAVEEAERVNDFKFRDVILEHMDVRRDALERALRDGTSRERNLNYAFEQLGMAKSNLAHLQSMKIFVLSVLVADGGVRLAAIRHQRNPGYIPLADLGAALARRGLARAEDGVKNILPSLGSALPPVLAPVLAPVAEAQ